MDQSTAMTVATAAEGHAGGLMMVVSPKEAKKRLQQLQAFVQSVMVKEVDYGIIPGTAKPTLYQPGAQKLAEIYGFAPTIEDVETVEDWDKPFFFYRKRCVLNARRNGHYIGNGVGSCNSREDRYAWRWVPEWNLNPTINKAELECRQKRGRNGKTFMTYRVPNEDIFSIVNTLEKMACKRALIHAVIGATRSAGIFSQDLDDIPAEAFGDADEEPPPAAQSKTQSVKNRVHARAQAQTAQSAPPRGGNGQGGGDDNDDFISSGKVKYLWHLAYERATAMGYTKDDAEGIVRTVLEAHNIPPHPETPDRGPSTKMIPWRGEVFNQICAEIQAWSPAGADPTEAPAADAQSDQDPF